MKPRTRFEWVVVWVLALLLGGSWLVYSQEPATAPTYVTLTEAPVVGQLAPDFTLTALDGRSLHLADERGQRPLVLNFWATWCVPCRLEMPYFQEASQKYGNQIEIIGINAAESAPTASQFVAEVGVTYPILLDSDNAVGDTYHAQNLPTTLFINADGTVAKVIIGTISQGVLEAEIEAILP